MPVIEMDLVAREFAAMAEENKALREAMVAIRQLLPDDSADWQIHGVNASDRYVRIEQTITLALAVKRLPL